MNMQPGHLHPLASLAITFMTGAAAGLAVFVGAGLVNPSAARILLDLHGDGLDAVDAWAVMWVFGHSAILLHCVFPGILRD